MKKAISRRDFLKVVGVSAAALGMTACGGSSASASTSTAASSTASSAAAGAGEGGSGNDYKLTWNEVNGEDYGATVGAHTFAEKIEELSGGHITIDLYINGTLGSEAESMQGIQMGTLDIFRGNASSLPNYGAELIGTTGLPYFQQITGTTVSDDGIPYFNWADYTPAEVEGIFAKARSGGKLTQHEIDQYQSAFLFEMARIYNRNHYVMQLHIGTYLDANTSHVKSVGQSTGFDCCDDAAPVKGVGELLNNLTTIGELPKTIIYPLDGTKIETWAILAAGFCDNGTKAKVQLGAPWWFNDQAFGIQRQFEACANLYPVSLSVGMLTDSRSFISYPRHELYRRVLCSYLGSLVERGEYFSGEEELKKTIENVCFNNVNAFFGFNVKA